MPTLDDEARAARGVHLHEAAKAARLADMDLLKIARADLSAEAAVVDLQKRYPGAFKAEPKKVYAEMTEAERKAFCGSHGLRYEASRKRMVRS